MAAAGTQGHELWAARTNAGGWSYWCKRCGAWGSHKAIKLTRKCEGGDSKYSKEILSRIKKRIDPSGMKSIGEPRKLQSSGINAN